MTVLINPFEAGWANAAHVQLYFKQEGKWRVISNATLYPTRRDTFLEAAQHNPYVGGRPVLWSTVQTVSYRTLWRGKPATNDDRPRELQ